MDDPAHPGMKILVVQGTAKRDEIRFRSNHGKIEVRLGCHKLGCFSSVSQIIAYGGDGNDHIDAEGVCVPVVLFGGAGNDFLHGGKFNDILIGGDGNDRLWGGDGNDVMVGGSGKDEMHSHLGNDLLVGGALTFQDDLAAMSSILAEWTRTDVSLADRMNHLTNGGGLNGTNVINSTSLVNDKQRDVLQGTPCADWLVSDKCDKVDKLPMPKFKAKKGK
jgi:hypothetical protein